MRLGAEFVTEDNSRAHPVMLHRAILGSFERFIGILIEHYEGAFPAWLAPVQAVVMNISEKQSDFVRQVHKVLQERGYRVKTDLRNEKIGFKVRERTLQKIPYLLVVGDKEVENNQLAVRTRCGQNLGSISLDEFAATLDAAIAKRGRLD